VACLGGFTLGETLAGFGRGHSDQDEGAEHMFRHAWACLEACPGDDNSDSSNKSQSNSRNRSESKVRVEIRARARVRAGTRVRAIAVIGVRARVRAGTRVRASNSSNKGQTKGKSRNKSQSE